AVHVVVLDEQDPGHGEGCPNETVITGHRPGSNGNAGESDEGFLELGMARSRELPHDLAVAQENEARPHTHLEGAAERPARPTPDFDVLPLGVALEELGDAQRDRAAVAAPGSAELEQHRAL